MRGSASLNLHWADMQTTLQVLYLLWAEQVVPRKKMSGLIACPPNFDSWESPKARPEATTSFLFRAELPWVFAIFH